jgi:predicted nucleic acid-binding protein
LVLADDSGARRLLIAGGFQVQGTIGILEAGFARKYVADIRQSFARLLTRGVYLERAFLDSRLKMLGLPAL